MRKKKWLLLALQKSKLSALFSREQQQSKLTGILLPIPILRSHIKKPEKTATKSKPFLSGENMERKKCEECSGNIKRKKVDFKIYGESLGLFPAEVCTKCGEEIFTEETSDAIDEAAKRKGLWGLEAQAKITRVGSSYAVIINKKIAEFMGLKQGEAVHIHPETRKKIVIQV